MWPQQVERIAAVLRRAGALGRLEELPAGVEDPPGPSARAVGFRCNGRTLVVLMAGDAIVDRDRLARFAGCESLRPSPPPEFPFHGSRVFVDRAVLATSTVWVEAGTRRHFFGLAPAELVRLTRAAASNFALED